jgi:hypothetical protein
MKMKKLLFTTLALGLLSLPAFAEDKTPEQLREEDSHIFFHDGMQQHKVTRTVVSGKEQRVWFNSHVHPDCSSAGEMVVRITKEPEHGKVSVASGKEYPGYPKESIRYKCNQHKVDVKKLLYKSEDKYTGDDAFQALIIFEDGYAWVVLIDLKVR